MSDKSKSTTDTADDSDRSPQVGALLRASRERVGEDLRNVSDDLCIRFLYLEAIEECRYDDLPGDTYAIGFIRSYAEHLGLDGEEVIRRYRMERASGKRLSDLSFPTPVPESGVPKGAIVLVGAVLSVLVYGGWYVSTTEDTILSDLIAPVPERLQHLAESENTSSDAAVSEPEQSSSSVEESSESGVQNEPSVNSETQEALQANTAEAIAEATEAARDNIEDTSATAEATVEAEAATAETETEAASEGIGETVETSVEQTTEQVAEIAESTTAVAEEVVETAESLVTEVTGGAGTSEPEPSTSQTDAMAQTVDNNDAATPANQVAASEPEAVTTELSSTSEAATAEATASAPEAIENAEANTASVAEDTTAPESESQPATQEVSAEDLNALALQAASGSATPEPEQSPSVETVSASSPVASTTTPGDASSGIVIQASDNSWVQVTDPASGEVLFTGLMAPGALFDVPARSGLLLDTGNAGAIDVIVNGATAPKLGGVGDVRKGIALDGARLIAGTAGN